MSDMVSRDALLEELQKAEANEGGENPDFEKTILYAEESVLKKLIAERDTEQREEEAFQKSLIDRIEKAMPKRTVDSPKDGVSDLPSRGAQIVGLGVPTDYPIIDELKVRTSGLIDFIDGLSEDGPEKEIAINHVRSGYHHARLHHANSLLDYDIVGFTPESQL